ncbi:predicted protein [Plenodomus lingam JN3]|uniref:Predicted protein n=1 Tax=Leptosphaeria maculans (strain JN3 / isolate v23.1.3 / race Av1-4-5-6-7-8) TaxID=985895 RepID=E4ZY08_LEPMJ|nr:predicted protein [Plenodomus lingam JN3]CBX96253.1 predicted protein [Plenodomus lingam JN3]
MVSYAVVKQCSRPIAELFSPSESQADLLFLVAKPIKPTVFEEETGRYQYNNQLEANVPAMTLWKDPHPTIMKLTLVTAVLVQAVAISADVEYCSSSAFTLPSNYKCSNREGRTGTYCCHFAAGGPYVDEKLCAHPLDKNDEQVSMSCIDSKGCLEQ